jgi:hypothetical protein
MDSKSYEGTFDPYPASAGRRSLLRVTTRKKDGKEQRYRRAPVVQTLGLGAPLLPSHARFRGNVRHHTRLSKRYDQSQLEPFAWSSVLALRSEYL